MNSAFKKKLLSLLILASGYVQGAPSAQESPLKTLPLSELEQRLESIDTELNDLSSISLRSGVGNLGWISRMRKGDPTTEWALIDLGEPVPIDQVVLVPVIWRDTKAGFQADCFPCEFKIVVGTGEQDKGRTVAEFGPEDKLLPHIAPLVIPISPVTASWVRIVARTEPSKMWDGKQCVQLAEMLVLSGSENSALHRPVRASSNQGNPVKNAMSMQALTDGIMPYLMDAAEGEISDPYITFYDVKDNYSLTIDLGESLPVNEIHLHAADIRENIPRIHHADYAMPKHLRIEGASLPDFSDAVLLSEYLRETVYEMGPIITLRFPETRCRYVRLTAVEGYGAPEAKGKVRNVGFAEIELLSQGKNVALGKIVTDKVTKKINQQGHLANLTDGRNHYGNILPIKEWLNELALRHDLEVERPFVTAELRSRYTRQQKYLRIMYWVAGVLAAAAVLIVLIDRILRKRQLALARQRFAANLHDELGANLHAIGLLGDTARAEKDDPDQLDILLQRIRALTERSGIAARHCANLLEAEGLFEKVEEEMHQISERVTNDLNHSITIKGETALRQLSPRRRIDLLLFYKESLINIIRHSGATLASTHLTTSGNAITLSITDNGHGFSGGVPPSLKRRARLLRAKVTAESPDEGGTRITLKLKTRKFGLR